MRDYLAIRAMPAVAALFLGCAQLLNGADNPAILPTVHLNYPENDVQVKWTLSMNSIGECCVVFSNGNVIEKFSVDEDFKTGFQNITKLKPLWETKEFYNGPHPSNPNIEISICDKQMFHSITIGSFLKIDIDSLKEDDVVDLKIIDEFLKLFSKRIKSLQNEKLKVVADDLDVFFEAFRRK